LLLLALVFGVAPAAGADLSDPVLEAVRASLAKNIAHARDWLAAKDFKSLAQSAGGLELLAEVWRARGDDEAWQVSSAQLVIAAKDTRAAAMAEDTPRCLAALAELDEACTAVAKLSPGGNPLPPPRANVRTLMLLLDGVYADTKIALLTGQPENAKKHAYVLSELGRVVSNSRSGEQWSKLSSDFGRRRSRRPFAQTT
jgi:hypothetical protein